MTAYDDLLDDIHTAQRVLERGTSQHWPATTFDWRIDHQARLFVHWVDGPTVIAVRELALGLPEHLHHVLDAISLLRNIGPHGRDQIVQRTESSYLVSVPRTAAGAIDWLAAARQRVEVPHRDNRQLHPPGVAFGNLAEILRRAFDSTSFTTPEATNR
ncbi:MULTISPECIES: hypothetical protein [unclassified Nocardia]|uniref:hypothetical protein n=1 Tax=unclassified Nocardia TaxID=2637762 RepID=UPI001CE3E50F|nr:MULTISPECIES: hypothetical protein [unclassified Nocardia]